MIVDARPQISQSAAVSSGGSRSRPVPAGTTCSSTVRAREQVYDDARVPPVTSARPVVDVCRVTSGRTLSPRAGDDRCVMTRRRDWTAWVQCSATGQYVKDVRATSWQL
jgi:hypothetical protein